MYKDTRLKITKHLLRESFKAKINGKLYHVYGWKTKY